jgi:hypothetical protein
MVGLGWKSWSGVALGLAMACGPAVDDSDSDSGNGSSESSSGGPQSSAESAQDVATSTPPPPDLGGPDYNLVGDHLLAVSAVIDPAHPFQFIATVAGQENEPGGAVTLYMSLQPLALEVQSTTSPRTPVGDPIPLEARVDPEGGFSAALPDLMIVGTANPITGGDLAAAMTMMGSVGEQWCGTVAGMVTQPLMLDLQGSTFAFTRIDGELPDPVTSSCQP